jgi:hypothetical protein
MQTKQEREYQAHLIETICSLFPGCMVLKNDTSYKQGIPDLTVLYQDRWAVLEVKARKGYRTQPNQRYYVDILDTMSFGAFIYPENEEEVLSDLQLAFSTRRPARVLKREQVSLDQLRRG